MIHVEVCPICGDKNLNPHVKRFPSVPVVTMEAEGVRFNMCAIVLYSQCPTCEVFIQSPRMTDEDIEAYYVKGLYRKWLNVSQDTLDADEESRAVVDANLLLKLIDAPQSHLDIGSSRGSFLKAIGATRQVGIEPNEGYNKNPSAILNHALNEKFDLVSSLHSLEHTTNPMESLIQMANASSRYVVVEVPSDTSPGGWGRLAHTFYFPETTLHTMATKAGLKILAVVHTPHTFVVMEKEV